jgi:hypothetical protein
MPNATFIAITVFFTVTALSSLVSHRIILGDDQLSPFLLPLASFISMGLALFAARFVWLRLQSPHHHGMLTSIALGACLLGTIGFLGGYLLPILWLPESSQALRLGISITGPGGLVLGGFAGGAWWHLNQQ